MACHPLHLPKELDLLVRWQLPGSAAKMHRGVTLAFHQHIKTLQAGQLGGFWMLHCQQQPVIGLELISLPLADLPVPVHQRPSNEIAVYLHYPAGASYLPLQASLLRWWLSLLPAWQTARCWCLVSPQLRHLKALLEAAGFAATAYYAQDRYHARLYQYTSPLPRPST
ncbi:MAG: hypothetical protein P0Y53_09875 [Candidatus Pseudobacter hemicellulosilyticus]|uniref:Uncharacterized protein n=1 Tax=Candidatus Pseudobacter hemicellulosilyticus TaxID=3121375 RepID=A0AAJ5WUT8_9BACT|nr:MAG: hypothetical protein P0Y53_09875 [Pseudobacter sp.]